MAKMKCFMIIFPLISWAVTVNAQSPTQDILHKLSQIKQPDPPFNVKLLADKKEYHIGDPIEFSFRANQDCYLTLIEVATEGVIRVIFPHKLCPDNLIKAGKTYNIPRDNNFQIKIDGPSGIERFKAIVTTWKTDIFGMNFQSDEYFFFEGSYDDKFINSCLDKLAKKLKNHNGWTEASLEFEVLETVPLKGKKRALDGKDGVPAPKPTPSITTIQEHKRDRSLED